ncbi:MAG: GTP 3',8-cyclase MoaA [Flavobacteriaceae bacterium]
MIDQYNRNINYMRVALTDRCNLRCSYCMPAKGIVLAPKEELLSFEEMLLMIQAGVNLGVNKFRFTGGEPFVRKDIMSFFESVSKIDGIDSWHITTNGVLLSPYIDRLEQLGLSSVNLSLDTLKKDKFEQISRRNYFDQVMASLDHLLASDITVKLNMVVMSDFNADEIKDFAELSRLNKLHVRFIEEMPFNGGSLRASKKPWSADQIKQTLKKEFPEIESSGRILSGTSDDFKLKNSKGSIGVIPAFSRTICNDCNRIRISAKGELKNCLYDGGIFDFRTLLRDQNLDTEFKLKKIEGQLSRLVWQKKKDGFEAEDSIKKIDSKHFQSMSHIGG